MSAVTQLNDYAQSKGTHLQAIPVADMFVDDSYQRELDNNRARMMAQTWDPRLVGVLDVADRGPDHHPASPRYAIINGQHRRAAAMHVDPEMSLVCVVHTGLDLEAEAQLFWDIDRRTKKLSTWDRWNARRTAGDPDVLKVIAIAAQAGRRVENRADDPKVLQCPAALEWVLSHFDADTLLWTLQLLADVWPIEPEAGTAIVVKGTAIALAEQGETFDSGLFADVLSETSPFQIKGKAAELKARGWSGSLPKLYAAAALTVYNQRAPRGHKANIPT